MPITSRLRNAWAAFRNDGGVCTLSSPSGDFVQSLLGWPTAAGKPVTRDTAIRVASLLSAVKMLSNDIAKMPLVLRETNIVGGRQRTQPALNDPLYSLLKDCPNTFQTSYQLRWFLASQLLMAGNCFCQIVRNQMGQVIGLQPINAWQITQKWDTSEKSNPKLYWTYSDASGNSRNFKQNEIWHTTNTNLDLIGAVGVPIISLAKEAISVLMAAEEVAGRNFANGLGMSGFIAFPANSDVTEVEAQNVVDRLKKDFAGSQNAGKFTALPGDAKWVPMTWNAKDSQLLESRKWSAEEVVRAFGGAPLLVKLGLGEQNNTSTSSSAFIEDYWQTSLMPHCVAFEQSITRDLIAKKDRSRLYAKHDSNVVLRGSLRERAEMYEIQLRSGQTTPNEVRVMEDRDAIEGFGDVCFFPANSGYFDPATGQYAIPGQATPTPDKEEQSTPPDPAKEMDKQVTARLLKVANSLADRVLRKEAKSGTADAKFTAEVLACSVAEAEQYADGRKEMNDEQAKEALVKLVMGDTNRDSNGRFAPGSGSGSHDLLKTAAVHDQINKLYQKAAPSFMDKHDLTEHSFTVDANGQPSEITSSHDASKNTVTVHKDADGKVTDQAIVHSHPTAKDPHPSPADIAIAKQEGIPNYELSKSELWVANPDGTTAKVGDVEWKHGQLEIKWKG